MNFNILKIPRKMRLVEHVARMGKGEACTGFWRGNPRERDHWGDPSVDGRITSE
jgi:hypothetical protein